MVAPRLREQAIRRLKRHPQLYWVARSTNEAIGGLLPPRRYPEVTGLVHRNDAMLPPDPWAPTDYEEHGRAAVSFLGRLLGDRPWASVGPVLDFGSGYGRVTRHLAAVVPPGDLVVDDLDRRAVRFCCREMGARIASPADTYGVIWMGSVLTHLPLDVAGALLDRLRGQLRPGGLLAVSTLGPATLDQLDRLGSWVPERRCELEAQLDESGMAYLPYPHHRSYGLAWHTPGAVAALTAARGLNLMVEEPAGWRSWQDLWGAAAP